MLNNYGIKAEQARVDERTKKFFTFFKDSEGLPLGVYEKYKGQEQKLSVFINF